jgi:serine protease Do
LKRPGPWKHLPINTSTNVQLGDWCLALGYPAGFPRGTEAAVRLGRILNLHERELTTDCPLMGGDSGGALINLTGELIGIHSRVKNRMEENFHIPASAFLKEWESITGSADIRRQQSPSRQRPYLGLHAETDFDRVRIRSVHNDSPAKKAGLEPEDVILEFDGKRVSHFDEILKSVDGRKPGEEVELIINRAGKLMRIKLILGRHY